MGLMRCLYFIAAKFNLTISATHLPGKANTCSLADALSRNSASHFLSNFPQANHQGTHIPEALTNLLVGTQPDWTSPSWSSMFNSIFKPQYQKTQCAATPPDSTGTPISALVPATSPFLPQSPHYVSMSASSDSSSLNINQSNLISPVYDSSISSMLDLTHSSMTCPDFSTSCEASSPKRRRRTSNQNPASQ